ncbi:hypothetical protein ACFOW1_08955 [Parasediminibacterium paludis]|uniref:Adhesin domain-containing protein n=1 Tax=Parasediminibacterium paludis TaxID=908966 RepID=A0ABV8PV91_9BACT
MNTMLVMAISLAMSISASAQDITIVPRPAVPVAPNMPVMVEGFDASSRDFKDLKSKEVSVEVAVSKSSDIYLENTQRNIQIKTWDQPKVKVVTTVYYEGEGTKVSDEEWFEKLNISVKSLGTGIRIKSGTVSSSGSYTVNGNTWAWNSGTGGVAIFNSEGQNIGTKSDAKRYVTIYIPTANKLDIESKYADVTITDNVTKVNADITNGNLELQDATTLTLRSKYANVTTGSIKNAEIEFINGRLILKDIEDLDIDTKYSTIEVASVQKVNLISTNDEYEFDEVGVLQGRKNYGNLRITKLTKSIDLDGTNADVKVRNILAGVETIKFNNKYADIRLPLKNLKNYTVTYVGPYSNVYANFDRKPLVLKDDKSDDAVSKEVDKAVKNAMRIAEKFGDTSSSTDNKFTATVGDGKGTKIDMKCQNCTVDFK